MKPKITREDIVNEVRKEREEFSDSLKSESFPTPLEPVLAKIHTIGELGNSTWYEVVFYDDTEWCSYDGSDTFQNGEHVLSCKYCSEIL